MKLSVVCFLWHDKAKYRGRYEFGKEHVKTLQKMVKKNLTVPYEFVCVTNTPGEFTGKKIKIVPLDKAIWVTGTLYMKLMLWRRDIGSIIGDRILYLDLDCVVTRSLDPIVNRVEDVILWRNSYLQKDKKQRPIYDMSIALITAGARPKLYEDFDPKIHPKKMKRKWGGDDQEWANYKLSRTGEAYWTETDGIYDARGLRRADNGISMELPDDARIVFFPGSYIPQSNKAQKKHPWIKEHLI